MKLPEHEVEEQGGFFDGPGFIGLFIASIPLFPLGMHVCAVAFA